MTVRWATCTSPQASSCVCSCRPDLAREFDSHDELTVFAEVYDHIPASHGLQIATTLTRDDGRLACSHTDEARAQVADAPTVSRELEVSIR